MDVRMDRAPAETISGAIDTFGFAAELAGWLFWGWIGLPGSEAGESASRFTARYIEGDVSGTATVIRFPYGDLEGRGAGVMVLADCRAPPSWRLLELGLFIGGRVYHAGVGQSARRVDGRPLIDQIAPLAARFLVAGRGRETALAMLTRAYPGFSVDMPPTAVTEMVGYSPGDRSLPGIILPSSQILSSAPGFIDGYGYASSLSGWLIWGWIRLADPPAHAQLLDFQAVFDEGEVSGIVTTAYFKRPDLSGAGVGVVVFADCEAPRTARLRRLSLAIGDGLFPAVAGGSTEKLAPPHLNQRLARLLADRAGSGSGLEVFSRMLSDVYTGTDTLHALSDRVLLDIDVAILCPPTGLLLMGWRIFAPGATPRVRVRCGASTGDIVFEDCVPVERPDVISATMGAHLGPVESRCGFIAFMPDCIAKGEQIHIEVELDDGSIGFRGVQLSSLGGMEAIRRILGDALVRFDELDGAFDTVLGPAVASLNVGRLASPTTVESLEFGEAPRAPRCTVIVPLYGRIDFLEHQMAFFSERSATNDVEYIYVLDDPLRRRALEDLAQSVFARFETPLRILMLSRNLGFAPANNHGLRAARGDFVCFLNSDAFPSDADWLDRLVARLDATPTLGVIGPRLLYEDGSIQHEGCVYRPLKEWGGWMYLDHDHRGRRPGPVGGLRDVPAITGACMVMRRDLAVELGGFDEGYVIGDFEDSDLCKKVLARGLSVAVDRDVTLYHLERQSQAASRELWRQNLTLHNAWVHQRRWYPAIAAPAGPE